jgi:hypothetical protein
MGALVYCLALPAAHALYFCIVVVNTQQHLAVQIRNECKNLLNKATLISTIGSQ